MSISPIPLDGGRKAWLFLVGSVTVEGLLFGFQASYGVFLKFYKTNSNFGDNPFLPFVGLLSIGMRRLGSPIITPAMIRYPQYRTHLIWGGWIICVVSLIAASCASELWHLVLSQGLAFSIGFSILYYPMLNMLNDWWDERRGFAYGIQFGLAGLIATVLPFALTPLLQRIGSSWTLLAYAAVVFVIVGPALFFLRAPERPNDAPTPTPTKLDRSVFLRTCFTAMSLSNLFQGLVFYFPPVFLPIFASTVGLSSIEGTIILSVTNFATTVGQIGMGYLADIAPSQLLMAASPLVSALVIFGFWGLGQTLIRLLAFGILFGLFAGGFSVLYTRFATELADDRTTQTWLYTIFDVQRGLMVIIGGAVGGRLIHGPVNLTQYGAGEYKDLIIFSGVCLVISSLGGIGWFFRGKSIRLPRRLRRNRNRNSVRPSPSMEQLLSAIEHHIWLDTEKGLIKPDDSIHQRYLHNIRQAIRGQRTISIAPLRESFVSQAASSVYSVDFRNEPVQVMTPEPLKTSRTNTLVEERMKRFSA